MKAQKVDLVKKMNPFYNGKDKPIIGDKNVDVPTQISGEHPGTGAPMTGDAV